MSSSVQYTDDYIFRQGREGYIKGWVNIPPYSIAAIRRGTAIIWQNGWRYEKSLEPRIKELEDTIDGLLWIAGVKIYRNLQYEVSTRPNGI